MTFEYGWEDEQSKDRQKLTSPFCHSSHAYVWRHGTTYSCSSGNSMEIPNGTIIDLALERTTIKLPVRMRWKQVRRCLKMIKIYPSDCNHFKLKCFADKECVSQKEMFNQLEIRHHPDKFCANFTVIYSLLRKKTFHLRKNLI